MSISSRLYTFHATPDSHAYVALRHNDTSALSPLFPAAVLCDLLREKAPALVGASAPLAELIFGYPSHCASPK